MKSLPLTLIGLLLAGVAHAKTLEVPAGPDAQERVQTALLDARPGDIVALGAGRFDLSDGLSLDIPNVTIRGAGEARTILSFAGQKGAGEGLLITSSGVTVRDLTVQDSRGDGIKSKGVDQISFLSLTVEWTGGPKATNGAYGVYPVASTNVLIDHVTVRGASDAGIYVGQSKNIIVRNSRAEFNVAGIEIENSMNADVYDNIATRNAGGILVFDLPDLPRWADIPPGSSEIRSSTMTRRTSPRRAISSPVFRRGPGSCSWPIAMSMCLRTRSAATRPPEFMIIAYIQDFTDKTYNPLPRDMVVRDNTFGRNGWDPNLAGGPMLAKALGGALPRVSGMA